MLFQLRRIMSTLGQSPTPFQHDTLSFSLGGELPPTEYRFSVDEFFRLCSEGFFPPDARLELLEGKVVMMSPEKGPHFQGVMRCQAQFLRVISEPWVLALDRTLQLSASALQPDIMFLRGPIEDYPSLPTPANVGLLVEVADSSRGYDQTLKASVYAAAGIPEYWIVNLPDRRLEVHRSPKPAIGDLSAAFATVEALEPGRTIDIVLDGTKLGTVAVGDLLPKDAI
jgi:Uma2 family endonuclease